MALAAGFASAQTAAPYDVSYNGGTCTIVHNGTSTTNYALLNGQWSGGGNFRGVGSVTCEGTVTATFTWDGGSGNEDPPSSVVVQEDSNVSAGGQITSTNNGLGTASPRYTVKDNPGTSFTVTATPYARAENTSGSGQASALVAYRATGYPLKLSLTGTLVMQNPTIVTNRLLVGQQVTASLDASGLGTTGWQREWTVAGAKPFVSWDVATTSPYCPGYRTAFSTQATESMSVCFGEPAYPTVNCHVFIAQANAYADVSADLQIDGTTGSVGVVIGFVDVRNTNIYDESGQVYSDWLNLYDSASYMGYPTWGIIWWSNVHAPSEYYAQYSAYGNPFFVQLVDTDRGEAYGNNVQRHLRSDGYVLDTSYPYPASAGDPDGIVSGDAPGALLDQTGLTMSRANDSFNTYLMYTPPGEGQSVPIKEIEWFWAGQATKDSNGIWQSSACDQGWSYVADYPYHPEWTANVVGLSWEDGP